MDVSFPPIACRLLVSSLPSQLTVSLCETLISAPERLDWRGLFETLRSRSPALDETLQAIEKATETCVTTLSVETSLRSWGRRTCASVADLACLLEHLNVKAGCRLLQNYLTSKYRMSRDT